MNWWVFVKCEPKSSQLKEPKTNYFSLCALNLFNIRVSQFELNYWNKWTFPRHSNLLRCTCICMYIYIYIYIFFFCSLLFWSEEIDICIANQRKNRYLSRWAKSSCSLRTKTRCSWGLLSKALLKRLRYESSVPIDGVSPVPKQKTKLFPPVIKKNKSIMVLVIWAQHSTDLAKAQWPGCWPVSVWSPVGGAVELACEAHLGPAQPPAAL